MIYLSDISSTIAEKYLLEKSKNPFSTRVKSLLTAYGQYARLLDFWYQTNESNNTTAYIVRYGGEFIADILPKADVNEIIDFCKMAGGTVLMCKDIQHSNNKGIVMKLDKLADCNIELDISDNVDLNDYYQILRQNASKSFPLPDYEDYYVDLNHRLRKNTAVILGIYLNSKLVSCCVSTAVDNNSAVLSGVATLHSYKKQGYGSAVVFAVCKKLICNGKDTIFIQRAVDENYDFYKKIGFKNFSYFEQINLME